MRRNWYALPLCIFREVYAVVDGYADVNGVWEQGLDLDLAARNSTFTFVDGLTSLFVPSAEKPPPGRRVLRSPKLEDVTREISAAVDELRGGGKRILLFLDQPDCFLAVNGREVTSLALNDAILSLREVRLEPEPSTSRSGKRKS